MKADGADIQDDETAQEKKDEKRRAEPRTAAVGRRNRLLELRIQLARSADILSVRSR